MKPLVEPAGSQAEADDLARQDTETFRNAFRPPGAGVSEGFRVLPSEVVRFGLAACGFDERFADLDADLDSDSDADSSEGDENHKDDKEQKKDTSDHPHPLSHHHRL
jgi:hypothetical protein